ATQLADFVRRTAELVALFVSWMVFRLVHRQVQPDDAYKERWERVANGCVGAAMVLSGIGMLCIALLTSNRQRGNVIPGLVIAVLGMITNTWFWLRYSKLNRSDPNPILAGQSKLYRAKSLVDACVTIALTVVAVAPATPAAWYVDLLGSTIVAIYLVANGANILRGSFQRTPHGGDQQ
ncbi:MAG: cation transporter, partial [Firmicutes bacterium]|nr:cation transporter [Bacillota bacterium]